MSYKRYNTTVSLGALKRAADAAREEYGFATVPEVARRTNMNRGTLFKRVRANSWLKDHLRVVDGRRYRRGYVKIACRTEFIALPWLCRRLERKNSTSSASVDS